MSSNKRTQLFNKRLIKSNRLIGVDLWDSCTSIRLGFLLFNSLSWHEGRDTLGVYEFTIILVLILNTEFSFLVRAGRQHILGDGQVNY